MKLKFLNLTSLLLILLLISCGTDDSDDDCIENRIAFVTSVNAPNSGTVNETIDIEVNFAVDNGCGGFGKFIESENGTSRTIEVEARYEGCVCTHNISFRAVNYEFRASNPGTYELRFKSSPTEFITVDIVIN